MKRSLVRNEKCDFCNTSGDMEMVERTLIKRLREAFNGCDLPEQFTEHDPDQCWQCADAEPTLRRLAIRLSKGGALVNDPGTDFLMLNASGFKYFAPFLADFVQSGFPESDEFMTDVVQWYGLNVLENHKDKFNQNQKAALVDFALSMLIANRRIFEDQGFEPLEIEQLKQRWRGIQAA